MIMQGGITPRLCPLEGLHHGSARRARRTKVAESAFKPLQNFTVREKADVDPKADLAHL